jgi:hypothetical protein
MLRRAVRLGVVLVLLGAGTTLVVAWGSAILFNPHIAPTPATPPSESTHRAFGTLAMIDAPYVLWFINVKETATMTLYESYWIDPTVPKVREARFDTFPDDSPKSSLPGWARSLVPPTPPMSGSDHHVRLVDGRGWPWRAMHSLRSCDKVNGAWTPSRRRKCMELPSGAIYNTRWLSELTSERSVPMGICWLGFAGNTLVFGLIYLAPMLLMMTFRSMRGIWRRKHKRCGNCGFPIGVSPVCTECGADVARVLRTRAERPEPRSAEA